MWQENDMEGVEQYTGPKWNDDHTDWTYTGTSKSSASISCTYIMFIKTCGYATVNNTKNNLLHIGSRLFDIEYSAELGSTISTSQDIPGSVRFAVKS